MVFDVSMVLVTLGILVAGAVLIAGVVLERRHNVIEDRLVRYAKPAMSLEDLELSLPLMERVFMPILRSVGGMLYRLTPGWQVAGLRHTLALAGMASTVNVAQFQMRRLLTSLATGGSFAFVTGLMHRVDATMIAIGLSLAALGYMLPALSLSSRIKKRQLAIQRALPDAIDLLTVCVEAGAAFDMAMARVVDKWHGPLSDEFERLLADLRLGRPRREALKDLADRTGVGDVATFVNALIQADQMGVGLVKVLRVQSDQMRQRRRLRAEEQAQKAPVKMLFPLIFLIFPAVYIVILGPAALRLMETFAGGP